MNEKLPIRPAVGRRTHVRAIAGIVAMALSALSTILAPVTSASAATSLAGFVAKYTNVRVGDGSSANRYLGECVSLVKRYQTEVVGGAFFSIPNGHASGMWTQFSSMTELTAKYRQMPATGDAKRGDIAVYGNGTDGHVAIVLADSPAGSPSLDVFEQNSPVKGSPSHETKDRPKTSLLGYLRVKKDDPIGAVDDISDVSPGTIHVKGWAADPQKKKGPLAVRVYVDGALAATIRAHLRRADVHATHPAYGSNLGFGSTIRLRVRGGAKSVCLVAMNVGAGTDTELGCRTVNIADANPFGAFDKSTSELGDFTWIGWAADPNLPAGPLHVSVWVNGAYAGWGYANKSRPDVAAARPGYGPNLGFAFRSTYAAGGNIQVCVKAANVGAGVTGTTVLGCKDIAIKTVSSYFGHIVQWSGDTKTQKTAWYVDGQGKRHWIPDAKTYWCLRNHGAPAPNVLSARALDRLPDQNGNWATCR